METDKAQPLDLDKQFEAAINAAYPIPDTPHTSVMQRANEGRGAFTKGWQAARIAQARAARSDTTASASIETEISDRLKRVVLNHGEGTIPVQSKLLLQAADECDRFYNGMMNWKANAQAKDRTIIELRAQHDAAKAPAAQAVDAPDAEHVARIVTDEDKAALLKIIAELGWSVNGTWVITKSGEQMHTLDALSFARTVRSVLAASPASTPEASQQAAAEPIYQVQYQGSAGTSLWHDATEAAYHTFMPERRRIVYTGKQAAAVAAQPVASAIEKGEQHE